MLKRNFIKVIKQSVHQCSPVNLLHILGIPFSKNTSGRLVLLEQIMISSEYKKFFVKYKNCA